MAIDFSESVVHNSYGLMVTVNEIGDELTIWKLTDTRLLNPDDEVGIEEALRSEIRLEERTGIVMEDTGYTKIYRPLMQVHVFQDVEETVERILQELAA